MHQAKLTSRPTRTRELVFYGSLSRTLTLPFLVRPVLDSWPQVSGAGGCWMYRRAVKSRYFGSLVYRYGVQCACGPVPTQYLGVIVKPWVFPVSRDSPAPKSPRSMLDFDCWLNVKSWWQSYFVLSFVSWVNLLFLFLETAFWIPV